MGPEKVFYLFITCLFAIVCHPYTKHSFVGARRTPGDDLLQFKRGKLLFYIAADKRVLLRPLPLVSQDAGREDEPLAVSLYAFGYSLNLSRNLHPPIWYMHMSRKMKSGKQSGASAS
jgi:hypothetical protein